MNLIIRSLILILITVALSYGLVTLVNNTSSTSEIPGKLQQTTLQTDQTGGTTGENTTRPVHEGKPDGDAGAGFAMVEIGKNLGIIAGITLVVGLIQYGIKKIPLRKQIRSV